MADVTPEEAEAVAAEPPEAPPEVRPEEFTQGTALSVGRSEFLPALVEALRQPLDPNRVRTRQGRGSGKFEYLAGHDVKRRANELFGFGQWGSRIVELVELAAVEVESDKGKAGWHVGYRCIVEVWIAGMPGTISDVGFGDAVEYTPSARVTANELAVKEAATDALKRALTQLGDQFGLILYAKDDEKKRIERDANAAEATPSVERPVINFPGSWAEITDRISVMLGSVDDAKEWLVQGREAYLGVPWADATKPDKDDAFQRFSALTHDLEVHDGELIFTVGIRAKIRKLLAARLDGVHVEGPPWSLGPDEAKGDTYPPRASLAAGDAVPGMAEAMDAAAAKDAAAAG